MKPPEGTQIVSEPVRNAIQGEREGGPRLQGSWLLLGHAVERAETEDEVAAGDAHDFAIGKQTGESIERDAIVRIVERRDDHDFIGDVEIGVAGGEPLTIEI